jgi:hypothetical protein
VKPHHGKIQVLRIDDKIMPIHSEDSAERLCLLTAYMQDPRNLLWVDAKGSLASEGQEHIGRQL